VGKLPVNNPNPEYAVDALLAEYLRRIDAGESVDREEFIAAHPECADELREVLETAALVEFMAGPLDGQQDEQDIDTEFGVGVSVGNPVDGEAPTLPPTNGEDITRTVPDSSAGETRLLEPSEFGDYELLEVIGRGGMGVVYKARQIKMDRIVAVKMIRAGRLASDEDVQRFYTEAQAAGKIDHPNIVTVYEVNQIDGHHFFSMDYVEGEDLAALLKKGLLKPKRSARYLRDAALAIHAAHETGVLHRDMKPANILIDEDDRVLITDFGLAKHIDKNEGLTETGMTLGTPNYMPPEQAAGDLRMFGPHTDVYSMGAILFVMLTGRTPFRSDSIARTIFDVIHTEPPAPRSINKNADVDLETICLKCLAKEPANRYASAAELAEDLDRFLNDQPILAKPTTQMQKCWNWLSHVPLVAALVGRNVISSSPIQIATQRVVLGLAIAIPIFLWLWHRTHQVWSQAMPAEIRITTGNEVGLYFEVGKRLSERLEEKTGLPAHPLPSLGSLENQHRLIKREADLALVQIDALNDSSVAVIMPLYFEAAYLLVHTESEIESIDQLRGKRIAIGTHESGTRVAAEQILEFYGFTSDNYTPVESDFDTLTSNATIEAAIAITGEDNPALVELFRSGRFRLIGLPRVEDLTSEYPSFKTARVNPVDSKNPNAEEIATVRTAALLVARRDAPDKLIEAALEAVYSEPALHPKLMSRRQASLWQGLDLHRVSREFFHPAK
jgi:TRAP transporter TAXI family solute receptor